MNQTVVAAAPSLAKLGCRLVSVSKSIRRSYSVIAILLCQYIGGYLKSCLQSVPPAVALEIGNNHHGSGTYSFWQQCICSHAVLSVYMCVFEQQQLHGWTDIFLEW